MFISHPFRLFLATALLLNSSISSADSVIEVDMCNQTDKSCTAAAAVSIDNDDLFNMPSFTFMGMGHRDAAAVYTKSKSTMRTLVDTSQEVVWEGALMDKDRVGFATLVQMANGDVAGIFTTESNTYALVQMPDGTLQVQVKEWKDFEESGSTDEEQDEPSDRAKRAKSVSISAAMSVQPGANAKRSVSSKGEAAAILGSNRKLRRNLQGNSVIDVLVIITNRAMCEYADESSGCSISNKGPIESMIPVIERQTNSAMLGVAAEIRIVEVKYLPPGYDDEAPKNFDGFLDDIANNTVIQRWRNDHNADLVAMITGEVQSGKFGKGAIFEFGHWSATSHTALQKFTFTHELGHNLGCYHNRENSNTQHSYAHGLQVPDGQFRTVMAYNCSSGSCPRIPYFSTPDYTHTSSGLVLGDSDHNCAKRISETAPIIAGWR